MAYIRGTRGDCMNVLLINPNSDFSATAKSAPLGLLSIGTYIKERGFHVRIYDRNVDKTSLEKTVAAFKPDVVGISAPSFRHIRDGAAVSHRLRKKGIPVIWGGYLTSILPELILREGTADYVVAGEGEITFHELLQALEKKTDISQINGVIYLDETGAIYRAPEREFANLADFSPIDWPLVDPRQYFAPQVFGSKVIYLYSSKGCTGRCAFCANRMFTHSKCRLRPTWHVISEIKELVANYGLEGVQFADELFGMNKSDLYDLCDQLRGLNIVWGCQTRLGHLKREDLQCMYDAGCRHIYYGVESGSQEMLDRVHKGIDLAAIDRDFLDCREIGIITHSGFIIGFPDETEDQLRETVRLLLGMNTNLFQVYFYFVDPGSEFSNDLIAAGRFIPYQTLREWSNHTSLLGKMTANYSNVPTRDLNVVSSFFFWQTLFRTKLPQGAKWFYFMFTRIHSVFNFLFTKGILDAIRYLFTPFRIFLSTAWYRYAYPGIRKKYGLYRSQESGDRS